MSERIIRFSHTENNSTWTVTLVDGLVQERKAISYIVCLADEALTTPDRLLKEIKKASKKWTEVTVYQANDPDEPDFSELCIKGYRPMTKAEQKSYEIHKEYEPLRQARREAEEKQKRFLTYQKLKQEFESG